MLTNEMLLQIAMDASKNAYVPYSNFHVGAALECSDGTVFTGCNVENASYGATICAERTAFCKAVSEGERSFVAIAVAGGREGEVAPAFVPCGICRQVMAEFCGGEFAVLKIGGGVGIVASVVVVVDKGGGDGSRGGFLGIFA